MSTQDTAALIESVNNMTATVAGKMGEIDQRVVTAENEFDKFMEEARGEMSHILVSRNQIMEPASVSSIKGFSTIYLDSFEVTKEATITSSTFIDHTGNGFGEDFRNNVFNGYVNRSFHILRIKWTRSTNSHPARLDNNFNQGYQQGAVTTGCYLKILSGDVQGDMKPVIDFSGDWKFYGMRRRVADIFDAFGGAHTKLGLSSQPGGSGEALICLFGSVSGYLPYEKNIWGVFPEFARPSDIPAS